MDELDKKILKTLTISKGTVAGIAKDVKGCSKKDYQIVKYRIENMIKDGILERNGDDIVELPHDTYIGVLSLVGRNDEDYREVEIGTVIRIEKDGSEGFLLLDEL
jgi:hypothetical protein